jgi:hypothetical protein
MSWSIIDDKLERQKYRNVQEFKVRSALFFVSQHPDAC